MILILDRSVRGSAQATQNSSIDWCESTYSIHPYSIPTNGLCQLMRRKARKEIKRRNGGTRHRGMLEMGGVKRAGKGGKKRREWKRREASGTGKERNQLLFARNVVRGKWRTEGWPDVMAPLNPTSALAFRYP